MEKPTSKKVVLCISASIAAYKSAFLVRLFIKNGYEVKVVMTPAASDFITPLTLSTLSKNEVISDISDGHTWNDHVSLGLWADAMIIAPATANTIAKMANGLADNMVLATYLSAKCPVFVAPAMDLDMWKHPSTKTNIKRLESYGNQIIPVGNGELASGLYGDGRMAEPEEIISFVDEYLGKEKDLTGKKILITAGPTREKIDPVRYIGNHSSGKMGITIAEECQYRGASVDLVLGPTSLLPSDPAIQVHHCMSALEMYDIANSLYKDCDVAIFAAAVADYRVEQASDKKIKKKDAEFTLTLTKTIDIAESLGKQKQRNQINIGFALETNNEFEHAEKKLKSKNFDFVVLNSLQDKGAGFRYDTNKISIIREGNNIERFELKSKKLVAVDIVDSIVDEIHK